MGCFQKKAALLADRPHLGRPARVAGTRELVARRNYVLVCDAGATQTRSRPSSLAW
ncbi:hypothetical protein APS58_1036 [Paracidovorax citrulli]|nr:hypothetical protein APS58_1036 [Paracidovorax citrulli]SDJ41780.1 hypothetical protein SAMN04489709_10410 [Paracidovorax citrulli]